ncbi:hypothetical protein [Butyrivibrio proteoclasticus]|nr:hypothetical protein [Butyrivibrio proteoclasticus]
MKLTEMNWGQEFLPEYPDAYISEDLPKDDNKCPLCGGQLVLLKDEDKPYCSRCYMENKEKYGKESSYSGMDRELIIDRLVRQQINGFVE